MAADVADPAPDATEQVQSQSRAKDKPPAAKKSGRGGARPGSGRPKGSANAKTTAATDKALIEGLAQILSIPAIPAAMVGETWVAEHFSVSGPVFAGQLVAASKTSPQLRTILEKAIKGDSYAILIIGVFGYVVPPVMYFATSDHHPARAMVGVPPRRATVPRGASAPGGGPAAPTGAEPQRTGPPLGADRVPHPPNGAGAGALATSQPR